MCPVNQFVFFLKQGSNLEKKLSLCEPLPSITTPSPPQSHRSDPAVKQNLSRQVTSWLPDPFSSLSASEQTFVTMISGMGFPKARTSRAVLRLKSDEKEVSSYHILPKNRRSIMSVAFVTNQSRLSYQTSYFIFS